MLVWGSFAMGLVCSGVLWWFGLFVWEEGVSISSWFGKASQALVVRKNWVCGMDIMWQSACLVVCNITVDNYGFFFS